MEAERDADADVGAEEGAGASTGTGTGVGTDGGTVTEAVAVTASSELLASGQVEVRIDVCDTGPGIALDKLPLIFETFTQSDGSVSRTHGGTGLGLSLTRKLAELHGGSVTVETGLAKGSTFHLQFECAADSFAEPLKPAASGGPRARVLVVEDNVVNQKVVSAILRKGQYRIAMAENGAQGLSMLENAAAAADPFALVLMDIQMPVMDGLEATRRIRGNPAWRQLPIVAMTAHAMSEDRERCLAAGMNSYVLKPVKADHLLQTIERFVNGVKAAPKPSSVAGQRAAVEGLFQLFVETVPERLSKIELALARQDRYALQQETRRLAAAAERIAAAEVSSAARRIETVAPHEGFERLGEDLRALAAAVESLCGSSVAAQAG